MGRLACPAVRCKVHARALPALLPPRRSCAVPHPALPPFPLLCTDRYLLFKSSREELVEDIESLKKKIRCGGSGIDWLV